MREKSPKTKTPRSRIPILSGTESERGKLQGWHPAPKKCVLGRTGTHFSTALILLRLYSSVKFRMKKSKSFGFYRLGRKKFAPIAGPSPLHSERGEKSLFFLSKSFACCGIAEKRDSSILGLAKY